MLPCRVRLSVCPSATFVNSVNTSNRILRLFSPSGSQTILWDVECRWGRQKSRFSTNSWLSIDDKWSARTTTAGERPPCSLPHRQPRISESLFITTNMDDHDEENRTEQIWIVRSANLKRNLRSTYCRPYYWSYWQTQSIARPLCDSRATCLYWCGTCACAVCSAGSFMVDVWTSAIKLRFTAVFLQLCGALYNCNNNLAIANRSRVSCAHNTSRASIATPWH